MKRSKRTDNELRNAIESSFSIAQCLRALGLKPTGSNYKGFYHHARRLRVSTAHFTGQAHLRGKFCTWTKAKPLSEILVSNSQYLNTSRLKIRLLKAKLLTDHCYICGMLPIWNNKPLTLIMDHINGKHNDHRLENLRLVCPNCNSQLPTHAGRNKCPRGDSNSHVLSDKAF